MGDVDGEDRLPEQHDGAVSVVVHEAGVASWFGSPSFRPEISIEDSADLCRTRLQ